MCALLHRDALSSCMWRISRMDTGVEQNPYRMGGLSCQKVVLQALHLIDTQGNSVQDSLYHH